MVSDVTSFSPRLSSSRTIFDTICSTRSGSTGRLRSAIDSERTSLSRSNGARRPLRLITTNSRSCTRSKVVKRKLQDRQTRLRLIAAESSVGRESFTCVSRDPQLGQRIIAPYPASINRKPRNQPLHLLADGSLHRRVLLGVAVRQRIQHLGNQLPNLPELGDAEPARG